MNRCLTQQSHQTWISSLTSRTLMSMSLVFLVLVVGVYMYTLISTMMIANQKRVLDTNIQRLASTLSYDEMAYMNISGVLAKEYINEYGFEQANNVYFVARGTRPQNVAFATQTR
ncbi:hypothetical protein A2997_01495 [Candidatus Nomurabacteria bacterium RIFCSPLOWO2_01_FULL_36_10b]|uniref:Uncharacterized protein n=1 Tax=Candidatus Nomurabacteria bacterium RIFCSPLOWO2_01_FULL_36_10b TaxID=1801766 RepID=A0A1F6WN97_9BACT|nr:MAG: hypothetical protein A2997_01495 [Candidatus Nomurabacteria bacterium RIFCSPLOWO2_01_FULL_36_10b]